MKTCRGLTLLLTISFLLSSCSNGGKNEAYLFVSFLDPGNSGVNYAISEDGLSFQGLNYGLPVLPISFQSSTMRDPFITRDGEEGFHLVWTSGKKQIGYAWSPDLITWPDMRILPINARLDSIANTWAPELLYDEEKGEWIIYYSSTLLGAFPETKGQVSNNMNHRIYAVRTKDFKSFSAPELFFDPGYPVIDATVMKDGERFLMVFKDERDVPMKKQILTAEAGSLEGPWENISDTLTHTGIGGPSLQKRGDEYFLYYEHYKFPWYMGLMVSKDFKTWKDVAGSTKFPQRWKHGSFLKITREEADRLYDTYPIGETKPRQTKPFEGMN